MTHIIVGIGCYLGAIWQFWASRNAYRTIKSVGNPGTSRFSLIAIASGIFFGINLLIIGTSTLTGSF